MTGQIRLATAGDVPAVAVLEESSFAEPWSAEQIAGELERVEALVQVIECPPHPVSGYAIWRFAIDEVELLRIGVATMSQRRGLGASLLLSGLSTAETRGARRAHLEVRVSNQSARRLYERHGFVLVRSRRSYYPDGEDAAIYAREFV